jgi:hypothetical protein
VSPTCSIASSTLSPSPLSLRWKLFQKLEVFLHPQLPFHGIAVAEIMGEFGHRQGRTIIAKKHEFTRISSQQAGQDPQQCRLARAVRPGDHQRLAAGNGKAQIVEQHVVTAPSLQFRGCSLHRPPASRLAGQSPTLPFRKN